MVRLDNCFKGSKDIPPRLIRKSPDITIAEEHMEKANQNLFAAKLMHDNKFFDWTITCSYYAMYHATMASLWLIGLVRMERAIERLKYNRQILPKNKKLILEFDDYVMTTGVKIGRRYK